jgi:hypothetical protein
VIWEAATIHLQPLSSAVEAMLHAADEEPVQRRHTPKCH